MKKLLALLLVLSICMGMFSGCNLFKGGETQPTQEANAGTEPTEAAPEADAKLEKALDAVEAL